MHGLIMRLKTSGVSVLNILSRAPHYYWEGNWRTLASLY